MVEVEVEVALFHLNVAGIMSNYYIEEKSIGLLPSAGGGGGGGIDPPTCACKYILYHNKISG